MISELQTIAKQRAKTFTLIRILPKGINYDILEIEWEYNKQLHPKGIQVELQCRGRKVYYRTY